MTRFIAIAALLLVLTGCTGTTLTPSTAEAPAATQSPVTRPPAGLATAPLTSTSSPVEPTVTVSTAAATPSTLPKAGQTALADQPVAAASNASSSDPSGSVRAVGLQLIAQGFTSPVTLVPVPDSSGRLFVVDQVGQIRIITAGGKLLNQPFLDLRDRLVRLKSNYDERGLLGLAFHPDFAHNGRLFVYYVAPLRAGGPSGWDSTARLSEFKVMASDANRADPASERIVLQVDEPEANHKGGTVAFGPDGYLYLSLGDGGGANDVGMGHTPGLGNAQDTSVLLGKILRLDVDGGNPYAIPRDNPFVSGGGLPEIYAYGLRNAYRFSFDLGGTHALYAGDAGQDLFEEIDIVTRGGNYGWHIKEGTHCFNPDAPSIPPAQCAHTGARGEPLIDPIIEYQHPDVGIVVIGGVVYRGHAIPQLVGQYIFGDWSTGYASPDGTLLVSARPATAGLWPIQKLQIASNPGGRLGHFVLGFGQDSAGEVYVLTNDAVGPAGQTGKVFKVLPAGG